jgi:DNA polymerase III epsilon subunit family exonuclease
MLDFFLDNFYTSNDLLNTPLKEVEFTVLDFETTGLYPFNGDRIIEVGMVRAHADRIEKKMESLIRPGIPIPDHVSKINGITDDMVRNAPLLEDRIDEMIDFMKNSVIVAHNLSFDISFLNFHLQKMNRPKVDHWMVDTLKTSKILMPDQERYSLEAVTRALGIRNRESHRALADTEATAAVLQNLISKLGTNAFFKELVPFKIL